MFNLFSKGELRELWAFYFYKFMRGVFFLTTITLFIFYADKGLTYFEASIAIAFSSLMQVAFELVTGSVADTFGRKKSVVISLFIDATIIFFVAIANSFWQFFILLGLWGVSTTLASGADQAWAVDSLIHKKQEHLLDSFYAKSRSFFNAGLIVAGIISSGILLVGTNQTLWFVRSGLTFVLAIILALFAKEHFIKNKYVKQDTIKATITTAKKALSHFKDKSVLKLLGVASFFTFFASYLAESSAIQDYKVQANIPLEWWGILLLISTIIGIFTPHIGIRLSLKFKQLKTYLAASLAVLGIFYVLAITTLNTIVVACLAILYVVLDDFFIPVEEKLFNKHAPSAQRASIHSVKSIIRNIGLLLGITIAGVLSDHIGGAATIMLAGFCLIPAILAILKINEPNTQERHQMIT